MFTFRDGKAEHQLHVEINHVRSITTRRRNVHYDEDQTRTISFHTIQWVRKVFIGSSYENPF